MLIHPIKQSALMNIPRTKGAQLVQEWEKSDLSNDEPSASSSNGALTSSATTDKVDATEDKKEDERPASE